MKIVVIGGSGRIGTGVVDRLNRQGHEAVAASRRSGVNTVTGEGLAEALKGAQVVVDVTNPPSLEYEKALEFFETSGRNLLTAAAAAAVGHQVAVSVVGLERLPDLGYFRAKLAQENLIRASGIPFTLLRATQFFEFLPFIADTGTVGQTVTISTKRAQPVAAGDVVDATVDIVLSAPVNGIVEVAGPDRGPLSDFVGQYLTATGDTRVLVPDARAPYFGAALDDQALVPGDDPRLGATHFADWLGQAAHRD